MRTTEVKVYSFAELSDEAKEHAHTDWLSDGYEYPYWREARDTIKAFEREFDVRLLDWHFDANTYGYNLSFDSMTMRENILELSGNRARAWIWNNHGDILIEPTTHYYEIKNGKRYKVVGPHSRKYRSKVFFDRVYDGTCPWTGYCLDCDALDPLAYFAFGVEWSDKEKKRVAGNRKLAIDNATTIEDLLRECADSLFSSLQRDCEYNESMEAFAERCAANDYEFTEDGELWTGTKEIAA